MEFNFDNLKAFAKWLEINGELWVDATPDDLAFDGVVYRKDVEKFLAEEAADGNNK